VEPTFGLPACWIDPNQAGHARAAQWTVVDPATVLTTHFAEVVKENIAELLSYAETQKILAGLPPEQQKLVADLVPPAITVGGLQRILQALLAERISIRDMPTILEAVQEACTAQSKSIGAIVAGVRGRLARQISDSHAGPGGTIPVIVLSPDWEETLSEALVGPADDRQLALRPDKLMEFLDRLRTTVTAASQSGGKPVLLTSTQVRAHVYAIVDRLRMNIPVIGQSEVHRRAKIKVVATV
jgi:flagellar biosynthesis protein FlhA